jgi:TetR/AcrR family transcriptional repressor of nem operon
MVMPQSLLGSTGKQDDRPVCGSVWSFETDLVNLCAMRPKRKLARRNDPNGLRRKVLDAAFGLFQTHGYNGSSMHDLMSATALTGGALHHHFPSKKSLVLAVFEERVAPAVREAWIEPIREATSLGKGVQSVFEQIIEGLDARGTVLGCPLNNLTLELSLADSDFRRAAAGIFGEWRDALSDRILDTRGGRDLTKPVRAEIAAFIVSTYSGAMTLSKAEQNSKPLRSAARVLKRWLQSRQLDR